MRLIVRFAWLFGSISIAAGATAPALTERRMAAAQVANAFTAKTARINADKIKLSLAPKVAGENFKLLDATGQEIPATLLPDGTLEAVVDAKRPYVLTRPPAGRLALPAEGLQFPARYVTFSNTGAVNLGGLFLRPARVPLIWDSGSGAYTTELLVGYEFQDGSERTLPTPKTVAFFAEGSGARIQSDTVEIKRSGVPGYQRVKLVTSEINGETLFTARAGPADEVKSSVSVRREPLALKVTLPSTEIAAFGVGSGTLTVSLLARDGQPLPVEEPLEVQLSSRRLKLPATATIQPGKSAAEIEFRSTGFGSDGISVQSGKLATTQAIRLIFPAAAIMAALGGGALGGAARYFRNRRQARKQKPLLVRRLVEGVLVGIIFVGAAWTGLVMLNFSTGIFGTPFGAFVLATLSGYVGCTILDRVTERTFKTLGAES